MRRFTAALIFLGLLFFLGAPVRADWTINPLTGQLDYYEPAGAPAAHAASHEVGAPI